MKRRAIGGVDFKVIRSRLELIAEAVELDDRGEVGRAMKSWNKIIDFANRYNQSLDWIVHGDVKTLLRMRAREGKRT
jgi:hypothetical protein